MSSYSSITKAFKRDDAKKEVTIGADVKKKFVCWPQKNFWQGVEHMHLC